MVSAGKVAMSKLAKGKPVDTNSSMEDVRNKILSTSDYDLHELYQKFGHTMEQHDGMLVACKWKGKACTEKNFSSSSQSMGLCHTFNSGKKPKIETI